LQIVRDWIGHKRMVARNLIHRYGPARRFRRFEAAVNPGTWSRHDELLEWAEAKLADRDVHESIARYDQSPDPIVRQGFELKQQVLQQFRNRYGQASDPRILVHVPPPNVSSAYSSLSVNVVDGLRFLGINALELGWTDATAEILERFRPTILLTTDHPGYLMQIDWAAVDTYRKARTLKVGLNASLEEYGNTPLASRLEWAREHAVDFYFSFKTPEYVIRRYQAILEKGYDVLSLEFGANPLLYYPVPGIARDINYVFLGSTNPDKWPRYYAYFAAIWKRYPGYIDGPWWSSIARFGRPDTYRYLCARAKVALNLHIQNQIDWAGELNERLYNLAACGVPQLVDAPRLLSSRFQPDSFFVAQTPTEYEALFRRILRDPEEAELRALQAQREVLERHTIFHRLEHFLGELSRRARSASLV
jgi:hypothetical protein